MTFAVFIVLVLGLFIGALNLLPVAGSLPITVTASIQLVIGYMKAWNFIFPISEIFIAFGIVIFYELAIWIMHVLFRTVRFIRGSTDGG